MYISTRIFEKPGSSQIVCRFSSLLVCYPRKEHMNKNWKCPKRSGGGGQTKNPLLWGIFFGTNYAISGLSSWCQVNRGFKLLCMLGVQTKQRSFNNGKVNIYMHWFSGNIHLSTFHLCNSYDVLILTRKWSQCTEFVLFVIWK